MKKKQSKTQNHSFKSLFLLLFGFVSFAFTFNAHAQSILVNGTITDDGGMPVAGATVVIKSNPTVGTQSDFDGNYSITVPNEHTTLVFSYLGFSTKEIIVGNKTSINVVLQESAEDLDEVVVIGYGTQKKSDVTGAISQVKSEDLTKVVTTNPVDALQGRVSGVTVTSSSGSPGSVADITIRGIGSFGSNSPLYIIDGVQADPYYINANDIASIEILKDAASGAIYGTRAANGVIIITTKKGKVGKTKIEIESSVSSNTQRKKMELLDANGYVSVHKQMYENAGEPLPQYVLNPPNVNTNWIDETHRTGQLNQLNLRVSGASDNINYSVSGNYADEKGLLIGSSFTKKGINANINSTKGKLKINSNLNYSEIYREGHKFSLRETYFISPLIPVLDPTKPSGYGYRSGDLPDHRNPVGENALIEGFNKQRYFSGNVSFNYEIIKGLFANANYALSNTDSYDFSFHPAFKVRDIDDNPENAYAFVSEQNSNARRLTQNYTLSYQLDIDKHSINLMAGYERISEPYKFTYAQAEGYKMVDGQKVPALILDPNFKTLRAFGDGTYSASGTNYNYALVSQFGRVNYAFNDRYLLQASVRRDGSSKFGKNNQYGVFPSLAAGWKISDEEFMQNQNVFNFLKLRYSWGQAGNDGALGYYDYVALISEGSSASNGGYVFGNPNTSHKGSIARTLQNDNLQWETNTSSNFGIDFASLENKLKGAVNYYQTVTSDLLIFKQLSGSSGVDSSIMNVGEFKNNGLEFELGYTNKNGAFGYSAFGTFTTVNSKVTKLAEEGQRLYGTGLLFGSDHFVNITQVGHEPGAYFIPVADGIFQNQSEIDAHGAQPNAKPGDIRFVDQNKDGEIDSEDNTYQGSAIPKFEYSLNLSADYKGFDFNIFLQGVGGNKIYNANDFRLMSLDTGRNYRSDALHAWTPSNTNTNVPRAILGDPNMNSRASTRFLEKGDYLRVKTIQLGYSLPANVLETLQLDKFRIYATGQDLFTFTKYSGLDPEVGGSVLSRGLDLNLYPKYKSFIFGVQLAF